MATIVNRTDWSFVKATGVVTQTVTIPATTAGSTLVLVANGGAQVTGKITNTSGAAFSLRSQALGGQAVSISDFTSVGGETAVFLTLNGAENIAGTVYEVTGLGAFVAASNNGAGSATNSANDFQSKPTTAVNLASGSGVLFGAWTVTATLAGQPYNLTNRWRNMGPSGVLYNTGGLQPGANTPLIYASGCADVTSTTRWPENGASAGDFRATSAYVAGGTAFCVQALYANSGAAINPTVNAIVAENRIPGTITTNWYSPATAINTAIAGYCDKASYSPGDTVNFKVDSGNGAFRVEIYRLGYYGWENYGARNQLGAQGGYIVGSPAVQGAASVDGTLGSSSCAWSTTASWTVPSSAVPGVYYVLFRSTVTTTNVSSGHFVVRSSAATGKTAVCIPDMTYQAYNTWGATADGSATTGRSLYRKGDDTPTANFAHRAYAVSFDRPYATQSVQQNSYLFDSDQPWICFAEAQGYDLTYFSNLDLDANTTLLNDAALVVMLGHQEYWTTGVYDCFTHAVDAGVNMMVISSNTALWRCRFAAADTNRRTLICYKDSATRDVSAGFTGTGYDPLTPTGTWRDATATNGTANPDKRVEDSLTGQIFKASAPSATAMTVPFASKTKPIWRNSTAVQALTTGNTFTTTQTVLGDEVDYPSGGTTQPANLVQLSPTSYSSTAGANANGTVYSSSTGTITATFTLYRRSSGALVFNTGAWRGWEGISRYARNTNGSVVTAPTADWQNALLAMLYDLGAVPVAARELRPGADTALTNPATGAPTGGRDAVAVAYGLTVSTTPQAQPTVVPMPAATHASVW